VMMFMTTAAAVRRYRASNCALGLGKDGRCLKQRRQA
jgi:hypothetical protein